MAARVAAGMAAGMAAEMAAEMAARVAGGEAAAWAAGAGIANAPVVAFGPAAPGETTASSPQEPASGRRCGKTYLRRVVCIE